MRPLREESKRGRGIQRRSDKGEEWQILAPAEDWATLTDAYGKTKWVDIDGYKPRRRKEGAES